MHRLFGDGSSWQFAPFMCGPLQLAHSLMRLFKSLTKKGRLALLLDEEQAGLLLMLLQSGYNGPSL